MLDDTLVKVVLHFSLCLSRERRQRDLSNSQPADASVKENTGYKKPSLYLAMSATWGLLSLFYFCPFTNLLLTNNMYVCVFHIYHIRYVHLSTMLPPPPHALARGFDVLTSRVRKQLKF